MKKIFLSTIAALSLTSASLFAQEGAAPANQGNMMQTFIMIGLALIFFYFILWLAAFVTMTQVFNFFDLLGDIVKNQIPMSRVAVYHLFLTPLLVYETLPVSVKIDAPSKISEHDIKDVTIELQALKFQ